MWILSHITGTKTNRLHLHVLGHHFSQLALISWSWLLPSATWVTCCLLVETVYSCENSLEEVQVPLPVLTSRHLSYKTRGHVYSSCVRSAMLHASETWPLTKTNLQRNDRVMIRQVCSIKSENVATVRSSELLAKLELEDLDLILREREGFAGLGMWSVLVVQSGHHVIYRLMTGEGQGGPSLHGRNWWRETVVSGSSRQLTLKKGAPGDQVWDLLCVQLASYLERGPLMWMMPLHLHVNKKPDYDMMIGGQTITQLSKCVN